MQTRSHYCIYSIIKTEYIRCHIMDTKNIVLTGLFCLSGCSVTSSTLNQTIDIKMAQDKYNQALANHIQVTVDDRITFTGQRRIKVPRTKPNISVKYKSLPADDHQCIIADTMVISQHDENGNSIFDPATTALKSTAGTAVKTTGNLLMTSPSSSLSGVSSTTSDVTSTDSGTWIYGYDHNEYSYSPEIVDSEECREWIKPYLKEEALYNDNPNYDLVDPETGLSIKINDPTEQIRHLDPTEQIRQLDPTEQIRQLDPTEQLRQLDPIEQIRQLDPTEQIRQLDPTEQIRQLDPTEQIRQLDPTDQIRQLDPTDQIRQLDPTGQIKALNPAGKIQQLNPAKQAYPEEEINITDLYN